MRQRLEELSLFTNLIGDNRKLPYMHSKNCRQLTHSLPNIPVVVNVPFCVLRRLYTVLQKCLRLSWINLTWMPRRKGAVRPHFTTIVYNWNLELVSYVQWLRNRTVHLFLVIFLSMLFSKQLDEQRDRQWKYNQKGVWNERKYEAATLQFVRWVWNI